MNMRLIAVALVSATAALSSPTSAQNAAVYGSESYGRNYERPIHGVKAFRGAYNRAQVEPEFYNNGWVGEGAFDRSRPGGIDADLRPSD
jgi:hypothetical protein